MAPTPFKSGYATEAKDISSAEKRLSYAKLAYGIGKGGSLT